MASIPSLSSIFSSLTSISAYRLETAATPGDTTTTAALARDAATIPVTAITNFTAGDPFFVIGDGGTELNSVTSAAGLVITQSRKIALAQATGARVVEAVAFPLGHIAEDSASVGGSSSSNPIPAATSTTPIGYISAGGELTFSFGLLSFDVRTLSLAYGQNELETGIGTAGDPYQIVVSQGSVGQHGLLSFRAKGVRKDGSIVEVDMLDCTIDAAADVNISGKTVRPIPVGGRCTSHIFRIWA